MALKYFHFAVIIKLALTVLYYYSTILKFSELFRVAYCFTNICKEFEFSEAVFLKPFAYVVSEKSPTDTSLISIFTV